MSSTLYANPGRAVQLLEIPEQHAIGSRRASIIFRVRQHQWMSQCAEVVGILSMKAVCRCVNRVSADTVAEDATSSAAWPRHSDSAGCSGPGLACSREPRAHIGDSCVPRPANRGEDLLEQRRTCARQPEDEDRFAAARRTGLARGRTPACRSFWFAVFCSSSFRP